MDGPPPEKLEMTNSAVKMLMTRPQALRYKLRSMTTPDAKNEQRLTQFARTGG